MVLNSTLAATGLIEKIPLIVLIIVGVLLLVSLFIGLKKGGRRVSWTGIVWLFAALAFCLLKKPIVNAFPSSGETPVGFGAAFKAALPVLLLMLGCVLVALLVYGLFSLWLRPSYRLVAKGKIEREVDEYGFEYDMDYEEYDDYEQYTSRNVAVRKGYAPPKLVGRIMGALLCMVNAFMIMSSVIIVLLFFLNATALREGALSALFNYTIGETFVVQELVEFAGKYALDIFVIGVVIAFACKGNKNGFMETLRSLIVSFGGTVLGILCFVLPFTAMALPTAEGGNYFVNALTTRCVDAMTSLFSEGWAWIAPIVGKLLTGALFCLAVVVVMLLINWGMNALIRQIERSRTSRLIDGCLASVAYVAIGIAVCLLIWALWYVLGRFGIFYVTEIFTEEATLSNTLFQLCDSVLAPFIDGLFATA